MTLAGNQGLLDRLVAEHLPEALRFAVQLAGRLEPAEEIVQEALCRAARSLATFRGESEFRTWFYRIVISAFRDHVAASAQHNGCRELTGELADPRGEEPIAAAMASELREIVAQRISRLPPRQREVLILIVFQQLSPREVAEVLDISESNVYVNLHHARTRLREELAPYLRGD